MSNAAMPIIVSDDHHPSLRHIEREALAIELQHVLATLLDLGLQAKHAHWNVRGAQFSSLHRQLDELADAWRIAANEVAERSAALGGIPDGRPSAVASRSTLVGLPDGTIAERTLVDDFGRLLTDAIGEIRTRMDRVDELDIVTGDMLHGLVARLETDLWMVRSQRPSPEARR
ncbi:MAG: DNA starvation/stationary phase protection protein [Solirubrobacteraceae bacterium]